MQEQRVDFMPNNHAAGQIQDIGQKTRITPDGRAIVINDPKA